MKYQFYKCYSPLIYNARFIKKNVSYKSAFLSSILVDNNKQQSMVDWSILHKEFEQHFEYVKKLLYNSNLPNVMQVEKHFKDVVFYNIENGKRIRGLLLVNSFLSFNECSKNYELYYLRSHLIDDIMDNSLKRRGKPCWFRVQKDKGLKSISVNDDLSRNMADISLENRIHLELSTLFDSVLYRTCSGQCLDVLSANNTFAQSNDSDLHFYTRDNYTDITHFKTGLYTFYLPVTCGMILAGIQDKTTFQKVQNILLKLGHYFQVQDDYLDCYGNNNLTGKTGTDIIEGKCSWFIVEALANCSKEQKQILSFNYGKSHPGSEQAVKHVYEELGMVEKFKAYEFKLREEILLAVSNCDLNNMKSMNKVYNLFTDLVNKIFGRTF